MDKVLNEVELDAKKFAVLNYLHINNLGLTFHVIDERDKKPDSNILLIRTSFFNGVEPDTRKITGDYEEFAKIDMVNANSTDLFSELRDLNKYIRKDIKKVR